VRSSGIPQPKFFRLAIAAAGALLAVASAIAQDLSIREYKPKSTLVVPEHPTPRAKYPVIDIHNHLQNLTIESWKRVVQEMDELNLRVLVNLSGGTGEALAERIAFIKQSDTPDRMVFFATLDFNDLDSPGYGRRAAARLERDLDAGAKGLKIFKNLGLTVRRSNGERVTVDDPELSPVWELCAQRGVPVLIHTGEPAPFFDPVDPRNERWLELQIHPGRRRPPGQFPSFETLVAERNRLFARHAKTTFIAAHMGFHANDLGRLGRLLDERPNVYVETGAILAELGRQPRSARSFFVKYQDRILFGKDAYRAAEYPYFWRVFETADEYFDYYRDYHAFWKLYGLDLPDNVLRSVYFGNALKLVSALDRRAFPATDGDATAAGPGSVLAK